jgi:hypothetical protein
MIQLQTSDITRFLYLGSVTGVDSITAKRGVSSGHRNGEHRSFENNPRELKRLLNLENWRLHMNKIALSLVALTALTGAAFANDRTEEGTAASRNVGMTTTESAGANVVSTSGSDASEFLMIKRYGIEPSSDND